MRHLQDVCDIMTENPISIGPTASLYEAREVMENNDIRRLLVVDSYGDLVGILTMSDIQRARPSWLMRFEEDRDEALDADDDDIVRQAMTAEPLTIAPDDTIQEAAERMLEYKISGLPVVDGTRLVGIITESDIFRLIVESWSQLSTQPVQEVE